jgi:hypothetical protein
MKPCRRPPSYFPSMRIKWYRYVGIVLLLAWIVCFALPVVDASGGIRLNGLEALLLNMAGFVFVDTVGQYVEFLFYVTTNLWVLILIVRLIINKHYNLLPTALLSFLPLTSAFIWFVKEENASYLLMGYWVWLSVIFLVAVFSIARSLVPYANEKN